jgi:4-hydroxy-tetrahydrodipicolinate synthase
VAFDHPALQGVWLPLITPFRDGALDEESLKALVKHYATAPLAGFILCATTGEGMVLDEDEIERVVAICRDGLAKAGRPLPLLLSISGSDTRKVVKALAHTEAWPVDGYLVTCPYYTRPSQAGLLRHFSVLAEQTARPILIYNIPYRTGVNLQNDTMLELAKLPNIVGVKDCCADAAQSFDLVRRKPADFTVLTGEDPFYYTALTQGAEGAILASAHIRTGDFVAVRDRLRSGDLAGALAAWQGLCDLPRLLFAEPSPAPIKHWLWRIGLIASPEVRLPMTQVSDGLAQRLDREIERVKALG